MARLGRIAASVGVAGALAGGTAVTTQATTGRCGGRAPAISEHDRFLTTCVGLVGRVEVLREGDVEACVHPVTGELLGPLWTDLEADDGTLTLVFSATVEGEEEVAVVLVE